MSISTAALTPERIASAFLPYVKGGGVTSYLPVSAITDRLYARNQFSLIN